MPPFKLAILKSPQQFILRSFRLDEEAETKILNIEELANKSLQAILIGENLHRDELPELDQLHRTVPMRKLQDLGLTLNQMVEFSHEESLSLLKKIQTPWTLQNSIGLLEEFKTVSQHLRQLWPNDRVTFFEELWSILKTNWSPTELKIIFNDLAPSEKENEKNKLCRIMISGKRVGQPVPAGEIEEKIMDHYQGEFTRLFDVMDFNEQKGELVALATIQQSPVVIMAKVTQLNRLNKAVVQALIESLTD